MLKVKSQLMLHPSTDIFLMEIQVIIQPVHKFLINENFNNAVAANNASFDDIYLVIEIEFSLSVWESCAWEIMLCLLFQWLHIKNDESSKW